MAREGVSQIPDLERLLPFHHKEWIFQRLGWAVMSLFLAAAAAGLLGPGGLSRASAGDSRARLAYDRIGRREADLDFALNVATGTGMRTLRVAFSEECLRDAEPEWMRPQPDTAVAGDQGGLTYVYARDPEADRIHVEWSLKPRFTGSRRCRITAGDAGPIEIKQFILP
jgi:hypothetical protein